MMILGLLALRKHRNAQRARKVFRVVAYAAVVTGVAGAFSVHKAHAAMGEATLQLGKDLLPLSEFIQEPTALSLNGQNIVLSSASSDKPVHEVLDAFESYCQGEGSRAAEWSKLTKGTVSLDSKPSTTPGLHMGVFRRETGEQGAVMCFMRGADSKASLKDSVRAFADTSDLGKVGKMRYAYVTAESGGSHVLTAWTDDTFQVNAFVPKGDADTVGADPVGIPRPPEAQRLLAAQVFGSPYGTHIYRTAKSPDVVRDFYDQELSKAGWLPAGWFDDGKLVPGKNRIYVKGGAEIALATTRDDAGRTLVSLGEMGARPHELDSPEPLAE